MAKQFIFMQNGLFKKNNWQRSFVPPGFDGGKLFKIGDNFLKKPTPQAKIASIGQFFFLKNTRSEAVFQALCGVM